MGAINPTRENNMTACPRITKPTDLHQPGAIDQLIAFHRQTFGGWTMEDESGGSESGGEGGEAGGENNSGTTDTGFPADTPVADMTEGQQAAYYRHQARKHEDRYKDWQRTLGGKTAAEIAAERDELERLRASSRSEAENAVEEAKRTTRAEVTQQYGTRLVAAEFKALLTHVPDERREQIIGGLNLTSYITESGDVDTDKVKSFAAAIAPADTGVGGQQHDFGGGRGSGSSSTGGDVDDYKAQMERSLGRKPVKQ